MLKTNLEWHETTGGFYDNKKTNKNRNITKRIKTQKGGEEDETQRAFIDIFRHFCSLMLSVFFCNGSSCLTKLFWLNPESCAVGQTVVVNRANVQFWFGCMSRAEQQNSEAGTIGMHHHENNNKKEYYTIFVQTDVGAYRDIFLCNILYIKPSKGRLLKMRKVKAVTLHFVWTHAAWIFKIIMCHYINCWWLCRLSMAWTHPLYSPAAVCPCQLRLWVLGYVE